jgi:alpha-L-fucosidase 2
MNERTLWYRKPAAHWEEALPLGNGRLGAMAFGDPAHERIALNEDTLWSGYPKDQNNPQAAEWYPEAQKLALAGRFHEAQTLIEEKMLGGFTQSYLPLGDLLIDFDDNSPVADFRRTLDLETATHVTVFTRGGVRSTMELFASHPAQALFLRIHADKPGALNCAIRLTSSLRHSVQANSARIDLDALAPSDVVPSYIDCDNPVRYYNEPERRGMRCRATLMAEVDSGKIEAIDGGLRVSGADEAVIRLAARTSFNGYDRHPYLNGADEMKLCEADLAAISGVSFEAAKRAHIEDHRALFDRVSLSLGPNRYADLPTDERLRKMPDHPDDNGLFTLAFDFARYLLIAASRPGTQPMNLQGIWNQDLRAVWSCNYTININTQMNYWPVEALNLSELHEPMFDLIDRLSATGQETARVHYGARGAVAHHNTDLWALANPVGETYRGFAGCAFWPMGYGWLCRHLWAHYVYGGDRAFLKSRALPAIRLATRFYLDAMASEDGMRFLTPATSPENAFYYEGRVCKVAKRASMSDQIVREVLGNYLAALHDLAIDEPMASEAREAIKQIPPPEAAQSGRLLEWDEEYEESEPRHRHVSHLYGLYPGELIPPDGLLADACRKTLEARGDDGTGWSLGWKICLWARLGEGDRALKLLKRQLRLVEAGAGMNLTDGGSYSSLLDAHPPFQIDGNFGACAGIIEMLLSFRGGEITLLPACPNSWDEGSVRGLRAPGALVSFDFADGHVTRARITRLNDRPLKLRVNSQVFCVPEASSESEWNFNTNLKH